MNIKNPTVYKIELFSEIQKMVSNYAFYYILKNFFLYVMYLNFVLLVTELSSFVIDNISHIISLLKPLSRTKIFAF